MQTETQHSRSSSGFESLDGLESERGEEINETVAFNTKAAPNSANTAVTVSTVSFPSSTGLSQESKDSYIGATTITVANRSKRTVHMRVLATRLSSRAGRGITTVKTLSIEKRAIGRVLFILQHHANGFLQAPTAQPWEWQIARYHNQGRLEAAETPRRSAYRGPVILENVSQFPH
jgi:hypothetical protein